MEADDCGRDLRNCTICTCHLVVMAAISGADLLGLNAGQSTTVYLICLVRSCSLRN